MFSGLPACIPVQTQMNLNYRCAWFCDLEANMVWSTYNDNAETWKCNRYNRLLLYLNWIPHTKMHGPQETGCFKWCIIISGNVMSKFTVVDYLCIWLCWIVSWASFFLPTKFHAKNYRRGKTRIGNHKKKVSAFQLRGVGKTMFSPISFKYFASLLCHLNERSSGWVRSAALIAWANYWHRRRFTIKYLSLFCFDVYLCSCFMRTVTIPRVINAWIAS